MFFQKSNYLKTKNMTELQKLSDLSNVKTGDTIWTIERGYEKVTGVTDVIEGYCPIKTEESSYYKNGHHTKSDAYPSAFLKNPFEHLEFQEREMWVSDGGDWYKKIVVGKIKDLFVSYDKDYPHNHFCSWQNAKEIEPEQPKDETFEALKGITEFFEKFIKVCPALVDEKVYVNAKEIIELIENGSAK